MRIAKIALSAIAVMPITAVIAAAQPMPRFLQHPSDANSLSEPLREEMVAIEWRTEAARQEFWKRHNTRPNPGYKSIAKFRELDLWRMEMEVRQAIQKIVDQARTLKPYQQKIVSGWAKKVRKQLEYKNIRPTRTPRARFFY